MIGSNVHTKIKRTVESFLPGAKILLFGSQARGDNNQGSDYDLLIITKEKYSSKDKINLRTQIGNNLENLIRAPFDVLMGDENEIEMKKALPGHIFRTAMREGIYL
jgi:predicted nucleotidyltransferase